MVEVAEQTSSPHSKVFYSGTALFASLVVFVFTWGVFHVRSAEAGSDIFAGVLIMVFLVAALQALERLLWPEKASHRSRSLSDSTRLKIRMSCNIIRIMGTAGLFSGPFIRLLGFRDAGIDLGELSALLLFMGVCLADLIGERLFQPIAT
jgi:hypothetical protein